MRFTGKLGFSIDGSDVVLECGLPLRLCTWGNLITFCYNPMEGPHRNELVVVILRERGLKVIVRPFTYRTPDKITRWLVQFDNTFNDGMADALPEWIAIFIDTHGLWCVYRTTVLKDLKASSDQSALRTKQAEFF